MIVRLSANISFVCITSYVTVRHHNILIPVQSNPTVTTLS